MMRRRVVAAGPLVFAVVGLCGVLPVPAVASFTATTPAVSQSIGTATLGPATSPAVVRGTCVAAVGSDAVVSWSPSALATGYQVRYGTTNGGPYGTTVTVSGGATTVTTITGLAFSTTYYFVAVATLSAWTSASTSQVSVTTPNVLCL